MININILNKLIEGISGQLPLVNSYFTESPYSVWNVKEVKYGSISFCINKTVTRDTTTRYEATIYYADRLTEDHSNRDSIWSDAATVIQTIAGALNQADEILTVSYPISITLFEQDFADSLAGGYATMIIETRGMGECFEDELTVPEIVGTSAYFTKDELLEYFPTKLDFSNLIDDVADITGKLAAEVNQKLNVGYFDDFRKTIEAELETRPTGQDFNELQNAVIDATSSLSKTLNDKVGLNYFDSWADGIEAELETRPTGQDHEQVVNDIKDICNELKTRPTSQDHDKLVQAVIDNNEIITKELLKKVNITEFDNWADGIEAELETRPTGQDHEQVVNDIKDICNELKTRPTSQHYAELQNAVGDMTARLAAEINGKVSLTYFDSWADMIEKELGIRPSQEQYDELIAAMQNNIEIIADELLNRVGLHEFNVFVNDLETRLDDKADMAQLEEVIEATKATTARLAAQLDGKLDDIYFQNWKIDTEKVIDGKLDRQYFDQYAENVYTKEEITAVFYEYKELVQQYFSSEDFRIYLDNYVREAVITFTDHYLTDRLDYYTQDEINNLLKTIELDKYYTKTAVDEKFAGYYTKTEIDSTIGNINAILNAVLYEL